MCKCTPKLTPVLHDKMLIPFHIIIGTGGPDANTKFTGSDGVSHTRTSDGGIPDEIGQEHQKITNDVGTLSMANTGKKACKECHVVTFSEEKSKFTIIFISYISFCLFQDDLNPEVRY